MYSSSFGVDNPRDKSNKNTAISNINILNGAFVVHEASHFRQHQQGAQNRPQGQGNQHRPQNGVVVISGSMQSVEGISVPSWDGYSVYSVIAGATFAGGVIFEGGNVIIGAGGSSLNTLVQQNGVLTFSSGGQGSDAHIVDGTMNVEAGALDKGVTLNGGLLNINGGTVSNVSNNGGLMSVYNNGQESNGCYNGATIVVDGGTTWNDSSYGNGDIITVKNGGTINRMNEGNGGSIYISAGGVSSDSTVGNGHYIISSGGRTFEDHIDGQGYPGATILSGGSAAEIHVSGATLHLDSGAWANTDDLNGTNVNLQGTMYVGEGATLNLAPSAGGVVTIDNGSDAAFDPSLGQDGNDGIVLGGLEQAKNGGIVVYTTDIQYFGQPSDSARDPVFDPSDGLWHGGDSDGIVLNGLGKSDIEGIYDNRYGNLNKLPVDLRKYFQGSNGNDYVAIHLKDGGWIILHIDNIGNEGGVIGVDANGDIVFELCYLEGTHLLTPGGYKKIEDLRPKELVCVAEADGTFKGRTQRVKWIGRKSADVNPDLSSYPDEAGYAVCIKAGAFSDKVPENNLWVTPEHCFFFEGRFVPVRMLVNGRSIYYDYDRPHYLYYHLETEEHAILFAEGALSESYLDTGNRGNFIPLLERSAEDADSSILRLPPRQRLPRENYSWAQAAAPLDVSRAFVEPLWKRFALRTGLSQGKYASYCNLLGQPLTFDSQLAVLCETPAGKVEKIISESVSHNGENSYYCFLLPEGIFSKVILSSLTSRPCDVYGPYVDDRRKLGVLVKEIFLLTSRKREILSRWKIDENLAGWANIESVPLRWTTGMAEIILPDLPQEKVILEIQIAAQGPYLFEEKAKTVFL